MISCLKRPKGFQEALFLRELFFFARETVIWSKLELLYYGYCRSIFFIMIGFSLESSFMHV